MIKIYKRVYFETLERIDIILERIYKKFPKLLRSMLCFLIYIFNPLILKKINNKIICILPYSNQKLSEKKLNKITKKIYKNFKQGTFLFSFSSNIEYQEQIKTRLKKHNQNKIFWVEGKWIFSYLIFMIVEYISDIEQIGVNELRIDILVNELSDLTYYYIKQLASKVKSLKIITPHIQRFRKIEKELYEKDGIAIELSNNMKKSLSKSKLIINIDCPSKIFNKYKINKNAIIIHVNEKNKLDTLIFNGVNVLDCKINFSDKLKKEIKNKEIYSGFSDNILYESYIYRNDKAENIIKQIKNDEVRIEYLIGNKGKIYEQEFKKLNQFT